jgi:hypothetical protein
MDEAHLPIKGLRANLGGILVKLLEIYAVIIKNGYAIKWLRINKPDTQQNNDYQKKY